MHFDHKGTSGAYSTLDDPERLLKLAAEMLAHRRAGEDLDTSEEALKAMRQGLPPPEPGRSWTILMPGPNPFAQDQPSAPS